MAFSVTLNINFGSVRCSGSCCGSGGNVLPGLLLVSPSCRTTVLVAGIATHLPLANVSIHVAKRLQGFGNCDGVYTCEAPPETPPIGQRKCNASKYDCFGRGQGKGKFSVSNFSLTGREFDTADVPPRSNAERIRCNVVNSSQQRLVLLPRFHNHRRSA